MPLLQEANKLRFSPFSTFFPRKSDFRKFPFRRKMGCKWSEQTHQSPRTLDQRGDSKRIFDQYETGEQFTQALRQAGLEKCNLLFAIDFTKSNQYQGEQTFGKKCLHHLSTLPIETENKTPGEEGNAYVPIQIQRPEGLQRSQSFARSLSFEPNEIDASRDLMKQLNPYQYVLSVAGKQLEQFDDDKLIPLCIFGHQRKTEDPYVQQLFHEGRICHGISEVISEYESAVKNFGLSGDTQFTPVLDWAQQIVSKTMEYHILIIIGDGCINDLESTRQKLKELSKIPLSVVFVGVGDGSNPKDPKDKWRDMRILDDEPLGNVDNWQSVYLANLLPDLERSSHPDVDLAVQMFMEIPDQYSYFKKKGLIQN